MRVYRPDPNNDRKQYPVRREGCFVLVKPKHGNQKHHAKNQVLVRRELEMIDLNIRGFAVRTGTDAAPSLVRLKLYVDGQKLHPDRDFVFPNLAINH